MKIVEFKLISQILRNRLIASTKLIRTFHCFCRQVQSQQLRLGPLIKPLCSPVLSSPSININNQVTSTPPININN